MEFAKKILPGIGEKNPMNKLSLALDNLAKTYYPLCSSYKKSVFPDMSRAVELAQDLVYRINVPGYFYRFSPQMSGLASAESGLVIADTYNQIMHYYKSSVPVVYPDESGNYVDVSSSYSYGGGEGTRYDMKIEYNARGLISGGSLNSLGVAGVVYQEIKNFNFESGKRPAYYRIATYEDVDLGSETTPVKYGFVYLFNKYLGYAMSDPNYQGFYRYSDDYDAPENCTNCCGMTCDSYTATGVYSSYCFNSPTCLSGVENAGENYNFDKRSYFISTGANNHSSNNMIPMIPGESTHCTMCHLVHEKSSAVVSVETDYVNTQTSAGHGFISKDSVGAFVYWYRNKEASDDSVKYYFVPVKGQTSFTQAGSTLTVKPITCVGRLVTKDVTDRTTKKKRATPIRVSYVKDTTGVTGYQTCNVITYSRDKKTGNPTTPYGTSTMSLSTTAFSGKPPFETYDSKGKISFKKTPFKNASYNFDDDENIIGLKTIFVTEMYDKLVTNIDGTYELPYHVTNTLKRNTGYNVSTPTPVAFVPYLDDENPYTS